MEVWGSTTQSFLFSSYIYIGRKEGWMDGCNWHNASLRAFTNTGQVLIPTTKNFDKFTSPCHCMVEDGEGLGWIQSVRVRHVRIQRWQGSAAGRRTGCRRQVVVVVIIFITFVVTAIATFTTFVIVILNEQNWQIYRSFGAEMQLYSQFLRLTPSWNI